MDLEVKEVSELLNVPEETLLEWIDLGKIPAYSMKNRFRFNREEIEEWLLENPQIAKQSEKPGYNLLRALNKGDVISDIQAESKEELLRAVCERIAKRVHLDPEGLTEIFLEREQLASTAVGHGFAIPHARDFHLPGFQDIVTVVFLKKPIAYDTLDGHPVHTLFFLLACNDKRHLGLLSKCAHLIANPEIKAELAAHPTKERLLALVKQWESALGRV